MTFNTIEEVNAWFCDMLIVIHDAYVSGHIGENRYRKLTMNKVKELQYYYSQLID